jgi:hypothetical protein
MILGAIKKGSDKHQNQTCRRMGSGDSPNPQGKNPDCAFIVEVNPYILQQPQPKSVAPICDNSLCHNWTFEGCRRKVCEWNKRNTFRRVR